MPLFGGIRQMTDGMVSAERSPMPTGLLYTPKAQPYKRGLHPIVQTAGALLVHKGFFCTTLVSLVTFKLHRHRIGDFFGLRA
jgi:hypothetical protein